MAIEMPFMRLIFFLHFCLKIWTHYYYYYYTTSIYWPFFQDNLGKPAPERQTILDFTGARDDGVAVAAARPYANHLAADR